MMVALNIKHEQLSLKQFIASDLIHDLRKKYISWLEEGVCSRFSIRFVFATGLG